MIGIYFLEAILEENKLDHQQCRKNQSNAG